MITIDVFTTKDLYYNIFQDIVIHEIKASKYHLEFAKLPYIESIMKRVYANNTNILVFLVNKPTKEIIDIIREIRYNKPECITLVGANKSCISELYDCITAGVEDCFNIPMESDVVGRKVNHVIDTYFHDLITD